MGHPLDPTLEPFMLGQTLQRLIDQNLTTAREIGQVAGVSASTVYRWIAGQSQPTFDAIRLILRDIPDPRVGEAILATFTAGTPWHAQHLDLDLDVNDDGQIDGEDALDSSIETVRTATTSLTHIRKACRNQSLSADQAVTLISLLNRVAAHCAVTQGVISEMAEQRRRRKLKMAR